MWTDENFLCFSHAPSKNGPLPERRAREKGIWDGRLRGGGRAISFSPVGGGRGEGDVSRSDRGGGGMDEFIGTLVLSM